MLNHTPGPWSIEETTDFTASFRVMDEGECTVALCYQQPRDTWQAKDNAAIISASPEMLEALQLAARLIADHRGRFPKSIKHPAKFQLELACAAIGKALAKAEGGA